MNEPIWQSIIKQNRSYLEAEIMRLLSKAMVKDLRLAIKNFGNYGSNYKDLLLKIKEETNIQVISDEYPIRIIYKLENSQKVPIPYEELTAIADSLWTYSVN